MLSEVGYIRRRRSNSVVAIQAVRDAAEVIERDAAVRIVEEELERDYQRELSLGLEPIRMTVSRVERHELVWIVSWASEEYLRTRNPDFAPAGEWAVPC